MLKLGTIVASVALAVSSYASVNISMMNSSNGVWSVDIAKLQQTIKSNINFTKMENKYFVNKVKAQVIYDKKNNSNYVLVYIPSKYNYSFKVEKIQLDNNFNALSVTPNYSLTRYDLAEQPQTYTTPSCPDPSVQFVSATYFDYIQTAVDAVNKVYDEAQSLGYKSKKLIGNAASVEAYENWLTCPNLKGFFNVGDGSNTGIILSDGVLDHNAFSSLLKGKLHEHATVLLNSCEVDNDPLKSSVVNDAQAQKYGGGITTLLIGKSEAASACFWDAAFHGKAMTAALKSCNKQIDPSDTFGMQGNGSDYFAH